MCKSSCATLVAFCALKISFKSVQRFATYDSGRNHSWNHLGNYRVTQPKSRCIGYHGNRVSNQMDTRCMCSYNPTGTHMCNDIPIGSAAFKISCLDIQKTNKTNQPTTGVKAFGYHGNRNSLFGFSRHEVPTYQESSPWATYLTRYTKFSSLHCCHSNIKAVGYLGNRNPVSGFSSLVATTPR